MGFVGSDLWKVRQKWGSAPLFWPGVTVVAMNPAGKVWIGKRLDNGLWNVVGGFYELGDSAEDCARREVYEELGLEIKKLNMIGVITDPAVVTVTYPNGDQVQSPSHVFAAVLEEGTPHADDEHSEFEWVSLAEAERRVAGRFGFSTHALQMYAKWLETKEFQIR